MSLLEVLVAFSIMALSLGVLFNLYAQGPQAAVLAAETSDAILLAESQLVKIIHGDGAPSGSEGKYSWHITEREYTVAGTTTVVPGNAELIEYTVRVQWQGQREQQLEFSTLRAKPP